MSTSPFGIHKHIKTKLVLGYKAQVNTFQRVIFLPSIFSDHNAVNLEINSVIHSFKSGGQRRNNRNFKCSQDSDNENTTNQILLDAMKLVLKGKFKKYYIRKE